MYTSALIFALSGFLSHAAIVAPPPSWHNDYSSALEKCVSDKKPLAIVVGSGTGGWQSVSKDGELDKDVKQLLELSYVCVYIDIGTESGKKMATSLRVDAGPALIIGDRSGTNQAFRHKGTLSADQLTTTLKKYTKVGDVVTSTDTVPVSTVTSQPPSTAIFNGGSYCPSCNGGRR
jgi:hypothetical protein